VALYALMNRVYSIWGFLQRKGLRN
jgi:hypothetical protein